MSACSERIEFAIRMAHETGAPAHQLMPLLRRLHRLATTHQRRCEVQCNGCRTCHGIGFVVPMQNSALYGGRVEWVPMEHESRTDRRPCPTCSTKTVEDAIRKTCGELDRLRVESAPFEEQLGRYGRGKEGQHLFAPIFQCDPRGATVRIRVPSGASDTLARDGIYVPTSGRV